MGVFDDELGGGGRIPTQKCGSIGGVSSKYASINEVVKAYCDDKITGRQAVNELMNFFGQSENEANDIIYTENPCNKEVIPIKPDPGLQPNPEPDTDWQGNEGSSPTTQKPMKPLTPDQQFMLIGALVLFGIIGVVKR